MGAFRGAEFGGSIPLFIDEIQGSVVPLAMCVGILDAMPMTDGPRSSAGLEKPNCCNGVAGGPIGAFNLILQNVEFVQRKAHRALVAELPAEVRRWKESVEAKARAQRLACKDRRHTVFILDWDDTCCATSHFTRCGLMEMDPEAGVATGMVGDGMGKLAERLKDLELKVLGLLKRAVKKGSVIIVTNAGLGWVELSSTTWLPAVWEFLQRHRREIRIVSARAKYERHFPDLAFQWKTRTFFDELMSLQMSNPVTDSRNVIVLGDSVADRYAAHTACSLLNAEGHKTVLKVVKFLDQPNIDQLCKELSVLRDHVDAMVAYQTAFDVSMYKEPQLAAPSSSIDQDSEALTP